MIGESFAPLALRESRDGGSSIFERLNPAMEVPDDIYLSALDHARTPEEVVFRDVLVFHRDALNGGLDQALQNQAFERKQLAEIVEAYDCIGMNELAVLIGDAHVELDRDRENVTAEFDILAERYMQLTYGFDGNQPDAVEAGAIRFAQSRSARFSNIAAGLDKGASVAAHDEMLRRMEDLVRRIEEGR